VVGAGQDERIVPAAPPAGIVYESSEPEVPAVEDGGIAFALPSFPRALSPCLAWSGIDLDPLVICDDPIRIESKCRHGQRAKARTFDVRLDTTSSERG